MATDEREAGGRDRPDGPHPAARPGVARQRRGAERVRRLLDATLSVIARDGVGGLTLRAVAAEARTATGATTYYFGSRHRLLVEALRHHAALSRGWLDGFDEGFVARLEEGDATADDAAGVLTEILLEELDRRRTELHAGLELRLEARRHPELRSLVREWTEELTSRLADRLAKVGSAHPRQDAYLLRVMALGLEVDATSRGYREMENEEMRRALVRLVRRLLPASARPAGGVGGAGA